MKERFFTVSALMVFVAFAVFPMTLEADPGRHEDQYEMNKDQHIEMIPFTKDKLWPVPVTIDLTSSGCKENKCDSETYHIPKGYNLTIKHISVRAVLISPEIAFRPYATINISIPPFPLDVSPVIGIFDFSIPEDDAGQNIILSKNINFPLEGDHSIYITVQSKPNRFDIKNKMHVILQGYIQPVPDL